MAFDYGTIVRKLKTAKCKFETCTCVVALHCCTQSTNSCCIGCCVSK